MSMYTTTPMEAFMDGVRSVMMPQESSLNELRRQMARRNAERRVLVKSLSRSISKGSARTSTNLSRSHSK